MAESVIVKIKKDGSIAFDCNGFIGEGCDIIRDIENAVGSVQKSELKDEAFLHETPLPAYNELANL